MTWKLVLVLPLGAAITVAAIVAIILFSERSLPGAGDVEQHLGEVNY